MRYRRSMMTAVAITSISFLTAGTGSAGLRTSTERVLNSASRSICRTLDLSCKKKSRKAKTTASQHRAPAKQQTAKPKPKPPVKAPAPPNEPETANQTPLPEKKPPDIRKTGIPAPAPPVPPEKPVMAEGPLTVLPMPKPEAPKSGTLKPEDLKPPQVPPQPPPGIVAPPAQVNGGADCHSRLASLGVNFEPVATTVGTGQCSVADPVKLASLKLPVSHIGFPDGPVLACDFAVKFAEWLKDAGAPIVQAQASSPIAQLWTGPGYECRGRNRDETAKTSEHGFGKAVDITNFKLADGRMFEVKDALNTTSPAYAILKGLRGSACGYFTTVLGPGANAAHETHFHFDMGKHGASENYRICE